MIEKAIYETMDKINRQLPVEQKLTKSKETILFGGSSTLDSLGLVNFIISTEQKIEEIFGVCLSLADEKAMSQLSSPFRNVNTLIAYILKLLNFEEEGVN